MSSFVQSIQDTRGDLVVDLYDAFETGTDIALQKKWLMILNDDVDTRKVKLGVPHNLLGVLNHFLRGRIGYRM